MATPPPQGQPEILLISLEKPHTFDHKYKNLINYFGKVSNLRQAWRAEEVYWILSDIPLKAVLLTDRALTGKKHGKVRDAVLEYVRGGGTAICTGDVVKDSSPEELTAFFKHAGLSWTTGPDHHTTVSLNKAHVPQDGCRFLSESYTPPTVFLDNVMDSEAWYRPNKCAPIEGNEDLLDNTVQGLKLTPVALARIGEGRLGYVGYCNSDERSLAVILVMCGLHVQLKYDL
ncbi:hypothetical protein N7474_011004 [Penicillium riverlandense]|uniref:uncharacterized protein n=1 Tax=Penicillium riverlandense TaxID=1903569 RepID=UPI002548AC0F|nr:uncharacterized protein N7474_011004 [Penicillium riverlandense]KAJ5805117.1 hypothetical protein N7474_011004 [Penicillium riverlandense]